MGASPAEGGRRLFKRKIAEFSEKQYQNDAWRDARFGKVGSGGAAGGGAVAIPWAETESALRYELLAAVSEPRLASVLSKIGRVDTADRQQCRAVFDDLVRDVEEALVEDGMLAEVGELQSRWGALHRELIGAARKLVTSSFARRWCARSAPTNHLAHEHETAESVSIPTHYSRARSKIDVAVARVYHNHDEMVSACAAALSSSLRLPGRCAWPGSCDTNTRVLPRPKFTSGANSDRPI